MRGVITFGQRKFGSKVITNYEEYFAGLRVPRPCFGFRAAPLPISTFADTLDAVNKREAVGLARRDGVDAEDILL